MTLTEYLEYRAPIRVSDHRTVTVELHWSRDGKPTSTFVCSADNVTTRFAEAHALQIREALHAIVKGALLHYQSGNLDIIEATPPRTTS